MRSELHEAGPVNFTWSGDDALGRTVASGTYLVRVEAGQELVSQRVSLVR